MTEPNSVADSASASESPLDSPSDDELRAAIDAAAPLSDPSHEVFHVRFTVSDDPSVNNANRIVAALDDAFDLLGTFPQSDSIEAGSHDGIVDVVVGSAVDRTTIESALDPIDPVNDAIVTEITALAPDLQPSDLSVEDMSVDELLSMYDEYDDLDRLVEAVDDIDGFDDLGDAGTFDEADVPDEPDPDPAGTGDTVPGPSVDSSEAVDDAQAEFERLKREVDPVSFEELQRELADLEFEEFDAGDEVGFDELLDDDSLRPSEPSRGSNAASDRESSLRAPGLRRDASIDPTLDAVGSEGDGASSGADSPSAVGFEHADSDHDREFGRSGVSTGSSPESSPSDPVGGGRSVDSTVDTSSGSREGNASSGSREPTSEDGPGSHEMRSSIDDLRADVDDLQGLRDRVVYVSEMAGEVDDLRRTVDELDSAIDSVRDDLSAIDVLSDRESEIDELHDRVSAIASRLDDCERSIDRFDDLVSAVESIRERQRRLLRLRTVVKRHHETLDELGTVVPRFEEVSADIATLQEDVERFESTLEAGDLTSLTTRVDRLDARLEQLGTTVDSLERSLESTTLQSRYNRDGLEDVRSDLTDVRDDVAALSASTDDVRSRADRTLSSIDEFEETLRELEHQLQDARAKTMTEDDVETRVTHRLYADVYVPFTAALGVATISLGLVLFAQRELIGVSAMLFGVLSALVSLYLSRRFEASWVELLVP